MKESIRYSLQLARLKERKDPTNENIRRVQKLIYQLKSIDNLEEAKRYKIDKGI